MLTNVKMMLTAKNDRQKNNRSVDLFYAVIMQHYNKRNVKIFMTLTVLYT